MKHITASIILLLLFIGCSSTSRTTTNQSYREDCDCHVVFKSSETYNGVTALKVIVRCEYLGSIEDNTQYIYDNIEFFDTLCVEQRIIDNDTVTIIREPFMIKTR